MTNETFDFIVVGAGTAGCVIAARLSERPDVRVLLLEAGAREPVDGMATPTGYTRLDESVFWPPRQSTVQAGTGGTIALRRGRALGGSSSVNGMVFVRGQRAGYDAWPGQGAAGWAYEDLLPFFRRSERAAGRDPAVRGTDGPLVVGPVQQHNPLTEAAVRGAVEAGFDEARDINSGLETGFGWTDNNLPGGVRQSAADAYLRPILNRPNLTVVTGAVAHRLKMSGGRCVGVEYSVGAETTSAESAEVVVTAGAIGSPHLLLLSGIGPAGQLRTAGIEVVTDLSGVGTNLQDHPMGTVVYEASRSAPLLPSNPPVEALGLVRSDPGQPQADLQIVVVTATRPSTWRPAPGQGYTIAFAAVAPHSRGSVRLAESDPAAAPLIDPNYLGDERDAGVMRAGLRIARRIGESDALADWRIREALPGPDITGDADVNDYIRKTLVSYFHYSGTCRMGIGPESVVSPADLQVHGLAGLRIADASVMPSITAGNTNATVYAIAERAAEMILR